ncbi:MAG: nickel-responsive transcriptional regulator NikR [Candidatus Aenigmatarchaeota archaeon]|nr:MAG: nickel-responsive transcriptional regulator NikR [Candidatus Aenigmarchaeota archaeon]
MGKLARFGVSMDESLLRAFDEFVMKRGYKNRSQAISQLVNSCLAQSLSMDETATVVGLIVIVYNHKKRELLDTLIDLQHKYLSSVISSLHVHLDRHDCLEIIVVKGKIQKLRKIENDIVKVKGVKQGYLQVIAEKNNA